MISRVLLSAFVVGCLAVTGAPAFAQTVPGCNPQVLEAMTRKNDALVGYDMSIIQELMDKPDSVLAMTCFNRSAGLDGVEAGKIFSENFVIPLQDMVEGWLTAFYDEFADSMGQDPTTGSMPTAYSAGDALDVSGAGGTASQCDFVHDFWTGTSATLGFKNKGIQQMIPYVTTDTLRGLSAIPATVAGPDFLLKWGTGLAGTGLIDTVVDSDGFAGNVKGAYDAAMVALDGAANINLPSMPAAGFVVQNTFCQVLFEANAAGIAGPNRNPATGACIP